MRAHEVRGKRAGADHDQVRRILAGEIFRGQRRSGRRSPSRERAAVDHRQGFSGAPRHQQIGAVHRRLVERGVLGKNGHELAAEKFLAPRRHDQQRGLGARLGDAVMMAHRQLDLGAERRLERVDERRIGQHPGDVIAADDLHGADRSGGRRRPVGERGECGRCGLLGLGAALPGLGRVT